MSRKVTKAKFRYIRDLVTLTMDSIVAKHQSNLRLARYINQQDTGVSIKEALARIEASR